MKKNEISENDTLKEKRVSNTELISQNKEQNQIQNHKNHVSIFINGVVIKIPNSN